MMYMSRSFAARRNFLAVRFSSSLHFFACVFVVLPNVKPTSNTLIQNRVMLVGKNRHD